MHGFPESVTLAQMQAACKALGLPLDTTRTVTMDVSDGVTVTAFLTDDGGRKLHHGNDAVRMELHLPIARSDDADHAPAASSRIVLDVTGGDDDMIRLIKQQTRRRGA